MAISSVRESRVARCVFNSSEYGLRNLLVVFYIPTVDLVRLQGRITDSGNIIVNRPVPFSLVKEVWFCVPKDNDRRGFDHIEKIMGEDLEDEMALEYQASPILREFKKMKTPARLRQLLCDMPSGPHNPEKERLLRELQQPSTTVTKMRVVITT